MISSVIDQVIRFMTAEEIARLLPVCKTWLKTLHAKSVWRRQCLEPGCAERLALPSDIPISGLDADQMRSMLVCIRSLSSPVMDFNIIKQGIFQSSCDDASQGIEKTLDLRRDSFWSSTGSTSPLEGAMLVYELVHGLCVVKLVSITPFRAFYQQGMQCYGPVRARITVLLFASDEGSITYRGPWCDIENIEKPHTFNMGKQMIIGGALLVELEGRWSRQPSDQLYYVCLRDVVCNGVPVAAVSSLVFLHSLYGFVQRTEQGQIMSYPDFHHFLFEDVESMQCTVAAELSKRRSMIKCRTFINCRRINDLIETVFPSYYFDMWFRDEIARQIRETDDDFLLVYLNALDDMRIVLTDEESICLGEIAIRASDIKPFVDHVAALRISFTERLGDIFFNAGDYGTAMTCYSGSMVPDKVLATCAHLCSKPRTVAYLTILMRTYDNGAEVVESTFNILKERQHPHIGCVFLEHMIDQNYIDMAAAARLLGMPSANADMVRSHMRKQAALYNQKR